MNSASASFGSDLTQQLAADARALNDMRSLARSNPREGIKAAAQQFEAYFLQMVMKSMRDATPSDGLFDSDQSRLYTGLLDQQMTQSFSGSGSLGFARMIETQLAAQLGEAQKRSEAVLAARSARDAAPGAAMPVGQPAGFSVQPATPRGFALPPAATAHPLPATSAASVTYSAASAARQQTELAAWRAEMQAADWSAETPKDFVERVWPHAVEAAGELGVPPHYLVAHAALESGWGKHEPLRDDGSPSFNLFGIKAGRSWPGDVANANTTEFIDGKSVAVDADFRAYGSYGESFRDYAKLLVNSSRYSSLLGAASGTDFATSLQKAGYATDPMYADKLARIIDGATLRQALIG